jgi:hypothetical protein
MAKLYRLLFFCMLVATASAETVQVLVGNTGCRTKQLTVQRLWKTIPEMLKVEIVSRKSGDRPNQRVFILTTKKPRQIQQHSSSR